ncbi:unnamed protein product [Porites evermanni]|uniref:Protein kinase domain-containing protein n=1 Tax=Porites evermanni TaxID=104178 RepID=A0ABN8MED8_9CNID|nr:unnamed protein product [Porites evermanni]
MNIASKCRHPHLLQFISATNDEGNPLFVTELMEKSLRTLLEQRQLSETEIAVICLDVALALNYLHQKKPEPIIHRDISSANVLLWRQGDQWRGKVSDYGTANFMHQTMTVALGAMIYSAPEALTSKQTVKVSFRLFLAAYSPRIIFIFALNSAHRFSYLRAFVPPNGTQCLSATVIFLLISANSVDVYSFGALLCEMCIRQLPDPQRRNEQVVLVTNGVFRGLVRRCLQREPGARPTMQEIIDELKDFDPTS